MEIETVSSFTRRMQTRAAKKAGKFENKPIQHKDLPCGGYESLRPTKGWLRVSFARLRAQWKLAQIRGEA